MSRKTKHKSKVYGVLSNGQVVRMDTLETWPSEKRSSARRFTHAQVQWSPVDPDHTRAHREELKAS